MPTATMIVKLHYSDWSRFKPFLDGANAHRKKNSGLGHTLARDLEDPEFVRVVVRFQDLDRAKAWVEATSDEKILKQIADDASLSELPEMWLGEDVEDVDY